MIYKKTAHKNILLVAVSLIIFISQTYTFAEKTEKGLYFSQDLGASFNPLGVLLDTRLFYRLPLSSWSGILWESTRFDFGLQNEWTPADDFIGARFVIQPVAFFDLAFKIGFFGMYDLFGYGFFGFDSPDASYSSKVLDGLNPETVPGWLVSAVPTLKFQVKSLIIANAFALNRFMMKGSGYFLEVHSYTLHKTKDTDFQNDTYLMYKFTDIFTAGPVLRVQRVFGTSVKTERVCIIGILKPRTKRFYDAYTLAIAGVYIRDPLYKHTPYIGLKGGLTIKHTKKQ